MRLWIVEGSELVRKNERKAFLPSVLTFLSQEFWGFLESCHNNWLRSYKSLDIKFKSVFSPSELIFSPFKAVSLSPSSLSMNLRSLRCAYLDLSGSIFTFGFFLIDQLLHENPSEAISQHLATGRLRLLPIWLWWSYSYCLPFSSGKGY